MTDKPLIGISTCLLGFKVRYDGQHKLDHYLRDQLGQFVDFHPVCPEVECGLPIPREAIRLVDENGDIRLKTQKSGIDLTDQMNRWIGPKLEELAALPLCGYIFKSKSPSSGLYRIKVYKNGIPSPSGTGQFARAFTKRFPLLPVEEEGRLQDPRLRDNFITRLFAVHRWHALLQGDRSIKSLIDFHAAHKYTLMAHCPQTQKSLGKLLADSKALPPDELYSRYFRDFITALGKIATIRKNTNVLLHIMGYFKKNLSPDEKSELVDLINHYHQEQVPLIVPVTLINHYVRKYTPPYLAQQIFLNPHPRELMLRNRV
jgi:uncharacterized protein YbgA (DUF1722 family)/uncharacterized protein YbbK (DUF523 family)